LHQKFKGVYFYLPTYLLMKYRIDIDIAIFRLCQIDMVSKSKSDIEASLAVI